MQSKPWCSTVWALLTNSSTSSRIFSRISRSHVSLPQAFRPAILMMTPSGAPSILSTTLGLTRTFSHLDTTSFHVDGRYNSAQPPDEQVVHITQGYSRDHRPDLNQVMLELVVEHQAGIPVLMQPLSGSPFNMVIFAQEAWRSQYDAHSDTEPAQVAFSWDRED